MAKCGEVGQEVRRTTSRTGSWARTRDEAVVVFVAIVDTVCMQLLRAESAKESNGCKGGEVA